MFLLTLVLEESSGKVSYHRQFQMVSFSTHPLDVIGFLGRMPIKINERDK